MSPSTQSGFPNAGDDLPPRRWYLPSLADLIFLLFAYAILRTANAGMMDDPGLGWHLRNIDAIREQGTFLTTDPFSGPRNGAQYFTNQWLGDLALWFGEQHAGLDGIAVVTSIVIALTLRFLFVEISRDGVSWQVAFFWTFLAAWGISASWVARPNIFTILFLPIVSRTCERFHQGKMSRWQTLWLVPLFAVWANTHGGFLAGLITLGAATLLEALFCAFALDRITRQESNERCVQLAILSCLCVLATMINPYRNNLYAWVFSLLTDPYFQTLNEEWKSPDFHLLGAFRYELLILLLPLTVALTRTRVYVMSLALSVLWLHFALNGRRYLPLWVVVVIPLLARSAADISWFSDFFSRLRLSNEPSDLFRPAHPRPGFLWTLIFAAGLFGWAKYEGGIAQHDPSNIPAESLKRFLANYKGGAVFHDYNWGGFLTWHGWRQQPALLTFIDDRNEVQGVEHTKEYFSILRTEPGWEQKLQKFKIEHVVISPSAILSHRLAESQKWTEVSRDEYVVVYTRRNRLGKWDEVDPRDLLASGNR